MEENSQRRGGQGTSVHRSSLNRVYMACEQTSPLLSPYGRKLPEEGRARDICTQVITNQVFAQIKAHNDQ